LLVDGAKAAKTNGRVAPCTLKLKDPGEGRKPHSQISYRVVPHAKSGNVSTGPAGNGRANGLANNDGKGRGI